MFSHAKRFAGAVSSFADTVARARRVANRIEALSMVSDAEFSRRGMTRSEAVRLAARDII